MNSPLFLDTLPPKTAALADLFQRKQSSFLQAFYLTGGTALSLQLGHRESEDLDFFSQDTFQPTQIQESLTTFGNLENTELSEGTLNTFLGGVKLQFLQYSYPLLEPLIDWQGIQLSSILDIGCTKLQTISMRGSKKDFIDLYFLLELYTLPQLFEGVSKKYQNVDYSPLYILKSLTYFEDADQQPNPKMHKQVSWDEVKNTITASVRAFNLHE